MNGPLTAYSDATGSTRRRSRTIRACSASPAPTRRRNMPIYGSSSANFWMDLQVDTTPPAGTSYRLWPGYPTIPGSLNSDTAGYTLATEFKLSQSCTLDNIWFFSASGAARPAHPVRDLERQLAERGLGHGQRVAVLVGSGRVRLGVLRLQRRHPPRGGLQGRGVLWRRVDVVPDRHRLLDQWRYRRQPASPPARSPRPGAPQPRAPVRAPTTRDHGPTRAPTIQHAGENYWVDIEVTPS